MNIFPSSPESWNTLFQAVSVILIAGTVLAGAGAIISSRIVSRNQARDVASANAEAAKANERAKALETQNLFFQLYLADPDRSRREVESRLDEEYRDLHNALSAMGTDLLPIPEPPDITRRYIGPQTKWRSLSDEAKQNIVDILGTEPKGGIEIISAFDGALFGEPSRYASALEEAFRAAGWTVENKGQVAAPATTPSLVLYVGDITEPGQLRILCAAFDALGIHPEIDQRDLMRGKAPVLFVGLLRR